MPNIPFIQGLSTEQQNSIQNLINSGRAFNQTDAQNFGYATGQQNYNQFIGQTGTQALGLLNPQGYATSGTANNLQTPSYDQQIQDLFTSFNINLPDVFDTNLLSEGATTGDLESLLSEQRTLRDKLLQSLVPSEDERRFAEELNSLRSSFRTGVTNEKQRVIPQQFITGRLRSMQEQFTTEEANLLGSLGLAQEARQAEQKILETGLSNITSDIDLQMKIQDKLEAKKQNLFTQLSQLRTDAQNRLSMIMDAFAGKTVDELDSNTVSQLQVLAQQSGIPFQVLAGSLELAKDKLMIDRFSNIQIIGQDEFGNNIYGRLNPQTGQFEPVSITGQSGNSTITSSSGNSYDLSTYASDPNHSSSVQNIINQIGKFNNLQEVDNYIQSVSPGSKITSDMISKASEKYGIGWEELVALMQQESYIGTSNVAANNNNPGGITWNQNFSADMKGTARPSNEGGNYVKFKTMQDGVNSVAYELAKRKTDLTQETGQISETAQYYADQIKSGQLKITDKIITDKGRDFISQVERALINQPSLKEQTNQERVDLIDNILNHKGLNSSVGPTAVTRFAIFDKLTGKKQDFIGKVQQLVDAVTLQKLVDVKGQGATFGQLSDQERQVIERSATPINQWKIVNKDGNVVGYNVSQKDFKAELDRLRNYFSSGINLFSNDELNEIDNFYNQSTFNPSNYY